MAQNEQEKRCENCIVRQINSIGVLNKVELKEVSDAKITKIVKKGETIFEEGEQLNGVFCIREGVSKISKLTSSGKDQILKLAAKGEILGQDLLISQEKSNLKATAVNNMTLCFIPKEKIETPIKNNSEFTMNVLKTMVKELNESNENVISLSQKNVKQRIAQALLYIQKNYGEDEAGYLKLNLSREDLSSVVGTAVETCIRNISSFKKDGYIKLSQRKIAIVDSKKLQRFIDDFDF